jgi:ABC-type molybdate transport system substrate-binding protein
MFKTLIKMTLPLLRLSPSQRMGTSFALILATWTMTYGPLGESQQTIVVVSGSELEEPLKKLEATFEQSHPNIQVELKVQGSQDMVNAYLNDQNDFQPTVLIPASAQVLADLDQQWQSRYNNSPFYDSPQPLAKTQLVAISWLDRGKVLFPDGQFRWDKLDQALSDSNRSWKAIGGPQDWGNFDLKMTDPNRSNSGQLTLELWARSKLNGADLAASDLQSATIVDLVNLVKRSVYQPPRSTDILLQEFISLGPNEADIAWVYESVALYRWSQANNQQKPYELYYLDPTIETVPTAAIVRRDISGGTAKAARTFVKFLTQPEQQQTFVQYGFRPVSSDINLETVPNSPWAMNIPGTRVDPGVQTVPQASPELANEMLRLWGQ